MAFLLRENRRHVTGGYGQAAGLLSSKRSLLVGIHDCVERYLLISRRQRELVYCAMHAVKQGWHAEVVKIAENLSQMN